MFARLFQSRHARKLEEARSAREKAQEAYLCAVRRNDCRAQWHAQQRLKEATHEVMRLELM